MNFNETESLICPDCGCENVHPTGVSVHNAGTKGHLVEVTSDGVHQVPNGASGNKRGVLIELEFNCEICPCVMIVKYRFHKGDTSSESSWFIMDGYTAGNCPPVETIWGD
jgi:hypothetical protein